MLISTVENIGREYTVLGIVRGTTVNSKNIGRDIGASFKTLVGGEIKGYTEMIGEAVDVATNRMIAAAERLGADAIIGMRYTTSSVMQAASEITAYGTAVKFK
mgnify:FL=1